MLKIFENKCKCGESYFGQREGGKAKGRWLGFDECPKCRKGKLKGKLMTQKHDFQAALEELDELDRIKELEALAQKLADALSSQKIPRHTGCLPSSGKCSELCEDNKRQWAIRNEALAEAAKLGIK